MPYASRPSPELWRKIEPLAREMRKNPTAAENRLWQQLRRKHLHGVRFRRQHVFHCFIVDFYCPAAFLVVEVDGATHDDQQDYDVLRTEYLNALGLRVLRFRNEDVFRQLNDVLEIIAEAVAQGLKNAAADGEHKPTSP